MADDITNAITNHGLFLPMLKDNFPYDKLVCNYYCSIEKKYMS